MSWAARFPGEVLLSSRTALGSVVLSGNTDLPLGIAGATKIAVPPDMGALFHGVRCRVEFAVSPSQADQVLGGYGYLSDAGGAFIISPFDFYVGSANHNGTGFMDFAFRSSAFSMSATMSEVYHETSRYATATSSGNMTFSGSDPVILSRSVLDAATFTAEMYSSYGYTVSVDAVYVSWFPTSDTPEVPPAPSIFPVSGIYQGTQLLTILATGGTVHYTTDGSDPTALSPVYAPGYRIQDGTTIKAVTVSPEGLLSPVSSASYRISGNKIQPIPSYTAHVLPYLLEQYKGDNP